MNSMARGVSVQATSGEREGQLGFVLEVGDSIAYVSWDVGDEWFQPISGLMYVPVTMARESIRYEVMKAESDFTPDLIRALEWWQAASESAA